MGNEGASHTIPLDSVGFGAASARPLSRNARNTTHRGQLPVRPAPPRLSDCSVRRILSPMPSAHTPPGSEQSAERWARVKATVIEALDLPDAERGAFIARVCGDDEDLKREVESLLANARASANLFETPAAGLLAPDEPARGEPLLPPGTRLGAYEIIAFLSAGGMGEVYRARHTVLGRPVAIKIVGTRADATAKRRLVREAQHASILSHPNICTIYEVGDAGDVPFIVMKLVEGRSLRDRLHDGAPPLDEALRIGFQVADALEHAHRHDIIHRDLKSSNVVVNDAGQAIVLDFGLAKRLNHTASDLSRDSSLTATGVLAGTLSHMAPEVLVGGDADARSDVWALGVLLYELAIGELPFAGRTAFETSSAILGIRRVG